MEIYISQQLLLFCGAALLGIALGLAYDLLRAVRRRIPVLLVACDLLFCAAVAVGLIAYAMTSAGGELRIYLLLGTFLGAVFYFGVCSAHFRPLWDFWMDVALSFFALWLLPLRAARNIFEKISRRAKKLFHFWLKWVKISNYRWEFILVRRRRERSRNHEKTQRGQSKSDFWRRGHSG